MDDILNVMQVLAVNLGRRKMSTSGNALIELIKIGAKGKKSKKGFYIYDKNGKKLNHDILPIINKYRHPFKVFKQLPPRDIVDRCILGLINEASKCLEEGIVNGPEDIDLASIFVLGFPPNKVIYNFILSNQIGRIISICR